ncbi:MAG: BON domain-containing protein [Planctomycetaceae bacterium]
MPKYGKWLLVLGIMAANPAFSSADGFLGGLRQKTPFNATTQQAQNQRQAEQVAEALKEARLNGYDIEIEAQGDTVRLDGKVRDVTHRALATQVCQSLPGIKHVDNNLKYVPSGEIQQTAATSAMTNTQVRTAVFESSDANSRVRQIQYQPETDSRPIGAENQAKAQQIGQALSQSGLVGYDIEIRYQEGTATLLGSVATSEQKQAASAAAKRVPGVRGVSNQLQISNPIAQTAYAGGAPQMMPVSMMSGDHMMMQGMMPPASVAGVGAYSNPHLPQHAWPAYAQYPNSAAVTYPTQYSASAFPYIGPFYPYPQVPLGWREAKLEWDDGYWQLNFNKEKKAWYWLLQPKNW